MNFHCKLRLQLENGKCLTNRNYLTRKRNRSSSHLRRLPTILPFNRVKLFNKKISKVTADFNDVGLHNFFHVRVVHGVASTIEII